MVATFIWKQFSCGFNINTYSYITHTSYNTYDIFLKEQLSTLVGNNLNLQLFNCTVNKKDNIENAM